MNGRSLVAYAHLFAERVDRQRIVHAVALLFSLALSSAPARAGCRKVGQRCDRASDCCSGARCKGGECTCKSGRDECQGKCYNLDTDEKHCGNCDTVCGAGDTCCAGLCVDPGDDAANCGGCGISCVGGETCCSGECVDLLRDPDHCGACDVVCEENSGCVAGICTTADGCPVGADTCSGNPTVQCAGRANCKCSRSTEGLTICGDVTTPGTSCGQCESSADCAAFGVGAFCVDTGSTNCCGPSAQNVCRLRCTP